MITKQITVNVTQEHIDNGKRCQSKYCPIALACKDTEGYVDAAVGPRDGFITAKGKLFGIMGKQRLSFNLPDEAITFVRAFDGRQDVAPFSFAMIAKRY